MADIAIVTDRASDVSLEERQRLDITLVPLLVRFGEDEYLDDGTLSDDVFWERCASADTFPQTSQPSVGMFEAAFEPLVAAGRQVLCPLLSGRLSGTFNAACLAARRFPGRVTVFDTRSLSLGQAFLVLRAAIAAQEGRSLEDIVRLLESVRARSHLFIALDTVEFLRRGGRAGRLMPMLDRALRALRIRPLLKVEDGDLKVLGLARTMTKALGRIADETARLGPAEALAVAHTRRPAEAAEFAALLAERLGLRPDATLLTEAGPALSAHAGQGVLAAAVVRRGS